MLFGWCVLEAFRNQYVTNIPWFKGVDTLGTLSSNADDPAVGTRGRIVLINRFESSFRDFGFYLDVKDNTTTCNAVTGATFYNIQDVYSGPSLDMTFAAKKDIVCWFLQNAVNDPNLSVFYMNFSSATRLIDSLSQIARYINPSVYERMDAMPTKGRYGTVIMDFPTEKLLIRLIESNF